MIEKGAEIERGAAAVVKFVLSRNHKLVFFASRLAGREIANCWLFMRAASVSRRFIRAYVSVYYACSVCVSKGVQVTSMVGGRRLKNDSHPFSLIRNDF